MPKARGRDALGQRNGRRYEEALGADMRIWYYYIIGQWKRKRENRAERLLLHSCSEISKRSPAVAVQ
jgi:hypothetical protein